jgi:cholesterol 7-dehydrogenase
LYSWELQKGNIKPIAFLGHELVAFRGESGLVSVIDAYCPHLGANLGVSGRIRGDCVECPFHGWRYAGDGKCTHIPGQNVIPPQANTRSWTVLERNQMIMVWYHGDKKSPTWEPEIIPEVHDGSFRFDAKADFVVHAHIQEIPENTADVAHLNVLHHLPWNIPIVEDHFRMDWQGWWRPGKEEDKDSYAAHVPVVQSLILFGKQIPFMKMTTDIHLLGPGLVLYLFHTPIGTMRLFETVTPAGPLLQNISLVLFSDRWTIRWFTKWFFRGIAKTLSQDCYIWNNKTYNNRPPLSKGDRYIPTFRKWFSQFYTETSISMQEASRSKSLDW